MRETHKFEGPTGGPCRHLVLGSGTPCGYAVDNRVHDPDATVATTRSARSADGRRDPVKIDGRSRRGQPWAELPLPSKVGFLILAVGLGAVFVSVCAALSLTILRMGGLVG